MTCPSCGRENAEDARFCSGCGTALAAPHPERRERKVLTVLFADLVGSTAHAEQLDPEDVDARLRSYHTHVREELERHGATVEKFIGDAVVALFGAPIAHEDDPERAVRAALAIRDWARDQDELQVRVAVNTGEALVTLDARPSGGEGMAAGDVLNTAARLQSAAPVNGVLVGDQTYRATERVIEYRRHDPVKAKGKADPVPVWEALAARSRLGVDVSQESGTPLVGRKRERELLAGTLHRVVDDREPQLVTLVGVPGIGKSRLVYELLEVVRDYPGGLLIYWRQGRCPPYGDGVAFWAFGEMVKAQAGILETDSSDEAQRKLAEMTNDMCEEDAAWVERALRPLVGAAGDGSRDSREEAFAAWRRLVEGMADRHPTVLVFEDLHWADEGLLDFVDYLVDWSAGIPLMCVCTARPELLERRAGWGGGKLNSTTIALTALSDEETHQLLADLLGRTVLPADLLQFAGGNPLYAEEYARMLSDRGLDEEALPETVQGIIAARLDALSAAEKTAIQNGAVFGKVFWSGSLAALDGGDPAPLHSLARKEFVRRERRSSVGGQDEYAFRHVLVRDVAYGQIPRSQRAEKHRRAAEWIESLSERGDDLADLLAHHYVSALEYGAEGLGERAARALREAGDRARELNAFAAAIRCYRAALDLVPDEGHERGELLFELGQARLLAKTEGREELAEAVELLEEANPELAGEALSMLSFLEKGDQRRALGHLERALVLVRDRAPSTSKAVVLSRYAAALQLANEQARAMELVQEGRNIAEEVGDADIEAQTHATLGHLRLNAGDRDGLTEMQRALELAVASNSLEAAERCYANVADAYASHFCALERCFELQAEGRRLADRIGWPRWRHFFAGERVTELYHRGDWDEAIAMAEPFLEEVSRSTSPHFIEAPTRAVVARIVLARGDERRADEESARALERGRSIGDLQVLHAGLACRAVVHLELGREHEARSIVDEFVEQERREVERTGHLFVPWSERLTLMWLCLCHGYGGPVLELLAESERWRHDSPWRTMVTQVLSGNLAGAADIADDQLLPADAAFLRLKGGTDVQRALDFYRRAGAMRYVREAEALIAKSA
jgi:class 3 adenylate cyclase/tetratricopeptide (TPR) repeat protein